MGKASPRNGVFICSCVHHTGHVQLSEVRKLHLPGITYYRVVLLYFFVLVYYDYRIPLTQERYSTLQKAVRLFPDILGFVNIHLILVRWLEINNIQFAVQVAHVTQVSQY